MEEKYLVFTVQGKRYALPSKIISEVAVVENVFPMPLVPEYVRGIINRYSVPYALIDTSFFLSGETSKAGKVIVIKEDVDKLALLIDDVTDIADLPCERLMKIDSEEMALQGVISAFFEWKDTPVLCLDIAELVSRVKQDFQHREV